MGDGFAEGVLGIRFSSLATTAVFSLRILQDPPNKNHTLTLGDSQDGTKPLDGRRMLYQWPIVEAW